MTKNQHEPRAPRKATYPRDETEAEHELRVGKLFHAALNKHGHAFQRRVWAVPVDLPEPDNRTWERAAYDFPVRLNDHSTHIDVILRNRDYPLFFVIECKRANPRMSDWCFARGYSQKSDENTLAYDRMDGLGTVETAGKYAQNIYGLHMEMKSRRKKGDSEARAREFDTALAQVFRGIGGLVDAYGPAGVARLWGSSDDRERVSLVPVVVTTAVLWVTETDLAQADLGSGNLPGAAVPLKRVPWLFFRHHLTPDLRYAAQGTTGKTFRDILNKSYARTVAVVGAESFARFLSEGMEYF